jgi:hypothetical protein
MRKYQILFVIATLMFVGTRLASAQENDGKGVVPGSDTKRVVTVTKNRNCVLKCEEATWGGPCQFVRWKIISVSKMICEGQFNDCVSNCK